MSSSFGFKFSHLEILALFLEFTVMPLQNWLLLLAIAFLNVIATQMYAELKKGVKIFENRTK